MSFKTIVVFAVLLLAVSGPILARSYALDGRVDDVTDKPESTTTTTTTPSTISTTTQQSTTVLQDDSPSPNNTSTFQYSEEDGGEEEEEEEDEEGEEESDEAEDRSDSGEPPDDPIDRSDTEREHSWTPVALVKGVSSKTPFQVYKQPENGEKPKRTGFRNVRTHRGSKRYSGSVTTQRPPPSPPRLISMTFPETDMSSYMIQNSSPEDSLMVGSENLAVTVVPPPVSPPQVREEQVEDAYASAVGGVPPALAAVTAAGVPGVVEDAHLDQMASQASHGPRKQQALFRPSEEWRNNYQYQPHQHSGKHNNDKVISANGEVIQLIPFTIEDTIPRTTPTYFPHPSFNEQLKKEEQNQRPDKQKENVYVNYHVTNPTPTKPTVDLTRTKPRPFPSVKQRPSQRNVTSTRINNHKEEKRNRRPSFVSKFNTDLSQDTGISTTRSPNKPEYSNHPNGAFSRQVFNVGNQTVVDVTPTPGGKKEISFPLNGTNQDRFNSSRNLKATPTQSTSLNHRPIYGGFDRYRVPAGRPKIGYNVRVRPQGSNTLHPHLHLHHHPHDNHGSASINVGRVVLPPNAVVQTRPKPPPGYVHRHPALVSIAHANPTQGAPPLQNPPLNGSSILGGSTPNRYPHLTNYPKGEYRPGGLPHPALIAEVKRPHNGHEHYPVIIQKYRYPPPPPSGYVKNRQPGLRPQVHPNDETLPPSSQGIRRPFHDDQRGPPQDSPGRYGNGAGKQGPVRQGGPSGPAGSGGPNTSNGFGAGGPGAGSAPSGNGGQNQQSFGEGFDGNRGPISTSLRNPYADVPEGNRDDSYSSSSINNERYAPQAPSYNSNNPQSYDNNRPQSQNPSVYTYPFPSNPADQNKSKPNSYRDEYDEYYSSLQQRVRPTTIRPAVYKNSNSGFSVSEVTQAEGGRRPDDAPKHYGFPKLPSSTIRPPQEDLQSASSSQSVQIGGNTYKDRNQGYSVYEEENYPTPRPQQQPKYTQTPSSTQGKTAYVSSSTIRPRYRPRRPALKTTTDSQPAAGSLSASYTAPPSFGSGDVGAKEDGDMTFTYAKTDYNGNVKWGVRHQVGSGTRDGEYGQ